MPQSKPKTINPARIAMVTKTLASTDMPLSNDTLSYHTGLARRRVQEITKHLVGTGIADHCRIDNTSRFFLIQKSLAATA